MHRINRILQVVYQMDRGGSETWLMHVLRHIDRSRFQFDFLVHTMAECAYDEEICRLGCRLFRAPHPSRMWRYGRYVRAILKNAGPYAAVHCHTRLFDGHVLQLAAREDVPIRIIHSHTGGLEEPRGLLRIAYAKLNRCRTDRYLTTGIACSREAGLAVLGSRWGSDPRWRVLPCSLDFTAYKESFDRHEVRSELRIPEGARVVGHVGRFVQVKNHPFLLKVFGMLCEHDPRMHLLLIGDGVDGPQIRQQAAEAGLLDRITFAGTRNDVPRLLLAAIDVFLFPSLFEGLPLTLLEAQASGLSCVCSDVISREADLVPALIRRMSLSEPPVNWARAVREALESEPATSQVDALAAVQASRFNLQNAIQQLEDLYSQPE